MDRNKTLLFAAMLTITGFACSSGKPYTAQRNVQFAFSPDRKYEAVVRDRTLMQKRWLRAPQSVGKETTLSMIRNGDAYTATGPSPETTFLTASCPSSDFSIKWADNSHLAVTVQGCPTANITDKKAQIAG